MSKGLYYFLFSFILAGLLVACSDPIEEDTGNGAEERAVERLIFPADNTVFSLSADLQATEEFEWQAVEASNGVAPKYEVIFFRDNETVSHPVYTVETTENNWTATHARLNEIAAKAGIEPGSSGIVKWAVRTYYGSASGAVSKEVNRIVVERPDIESEAPVSTLFLTGRGTEFGEDITASMEFSKISDTEFVIFSELSAKEPFRFVDAIESDRIRSFAVRGNRLVEDGSTAEVLKSGVYKIYVDFSAELVELKEITDISLFYCIRHRAINLQYEGRGRWKTISLINFSREAWGDEKRYKFRMTEGNVNKFLEKSTNDASFPMKETVIVDRDQQLWDGVWSYPDNLKDTWAKVIVDMSGYSHSIEPVTEDFSAVTGSWAGLADKSTSDFVKGFWNTSTKHFNNSLSGTINRYDYWPEAHAIDVIIDAYLRNGDHGYQQIIYDFHEGVKRKNGNKFRNSFYDDMAWHGLAHLRAFEATGDARYEASARDLWNWILEGWDDEKGGIKWNDQPGSNPGVPSTGPATIIGVRRWVKYGDTENTEGLNNLEWAKRMYAWMRAERHDPATGGVYDNFENKGGAWTYNAGTFLGAAMELYDVTGEQWYLEDAIRTADWTLGNLSVATPNNRILSDWAEQVDDDVNLFKGIFIRYFTRLIMHPDLPSDKRQKYKSFIVYNAKALLTYATATGDKDVIIYNYGWYFTPKNSFLRGQISGCMLIEALALLEKEGFL